MSAMARAVPRWCCSAMTGRSRSGNAVSSPMVGCQVNPASSCHPRERHARTLATVRMRKAPARWRLTLALLALMLGAPAVQAKVQVKIDGVDKDIEANLMVFLSLNRYRERDDIDADTMARLQERVDREVPDA